jgi:hypothetical protein
MPQGEREFWPLVLFLEVGFQGGHPLGWEAAGGPEIQHLAQGRLRGVTPGKPLAETGSQALGREPVPASPGPQARIQHPAAAGALEEPIRTAMGGQVLWQIRQDQGLGMVLNGGPRQPWIEWSFGEEATLRIQAAKEDIPPADGQAMPSGRKDIQEGREVQLPQAVHGAQGGHPLESPLEVQ